MALLSNYSSTMAPLDHDLPPDSALAPTEPGFYEDPEISCCDCLFLVHHAVGA